MRSHVTLAASLLSAPRSPSARCSKPAPAPEPLRAVKTIVVEPASAGGSLEYAGEIRARVESRLSFRVPGKVLERSVDSGSHGSRRTGAGAPRCPRPSPRPGRGDRRRRERRGQPAAGRGRLQALPGPARPGLHQRCRARAPRDFAQGRASAVEPGARAVGRAGQPDRVRRADRRRQRRRHRRRRRAGHGRRGRDAGASPRPRRPARRRLLGARGQGGGDPGARRPGRHRRRPALGRRRRQGDGAPARGGGGRRADDAHVPRQGRHLAARTCHRFASARPRRCRWPRRSEAASPACRSRHCARTTAEARSGSSTRRR